MTGYYRRFIKDYAKIARPLIDLTKKDEKFEWTNKAEESFQTFKRILAEDLVLELPDLNETFVLDTDASDIASGWVLSQNDKVVSYGSMTHNKAERNYGITEKECLACVKAIKKLHVYLSGGKFILRTDHEALKWLMTITEPTGRLARWAVLLQQYDFTIEHRPGTKHGNADALSRWSVEGSTEMYPEGGYVQHVHAVEMEEPYKTDPWKNKDLMQLIEKGNVPKASAQQPQKLGRIARHYKFIGRHLRFRKDLEDEEYERIVPKIDERYSIIQRNHLLGHFGITSTIDRIKAIYFWKGMNKEIEDFVKNCSICQSHGFGQKLEQSLRPMKVTGLFDRLGIDMIISLPESEEGFKHALVFTDYLSKNAEVYPMKTKTAQEVAVKLMKYIALYGPPKEMLSDQGPEFLAHVVEKLISNVGTERKVTSAYYPRCNGLTERFNKTFVACLQKHAEQKPKDWVKFIPFVLMAYRSRVQSSTKLTPYEVLYGKEMNVFESWESRSEDNAEVELAERALEIQKLIDLRTQVKENIRKAQDVQKKSFAKNNRISDQLEKGQCVYLKPAKKGKKFQRKLMGPFTIDEITKHGNYWLVNDNGERLKSAVNITRLKVDEREEGLEDDADFEVEKILDHKRISGTMNYFTKFVGYDDDWNEWIPETNFNDTEVIEDYWDAINGSTEAVEAERGDM